MLPESVTITTSVAAATADTAVEVTAAATPAAAAVTTAAQAAVTVAPVTAAAAAVATVTRRTRALIVVLMDRRTPTSPALSAAPKTARYSAVCNKPCVTVSVTSFTRKQTASNWYNLYYQVYVVIFNVMR